jgi:urea transporter
MLVTFDMKISKIIKNALIFTVVGLKRNLMALLGLVLITAIAVAMIVMLLPLGLGVTLVLPFIYYLGVCAFIYTYAAYPVIKKHMIDPVPTPDVED